MDASALKDWRNTLVAATGSAAQGLAQALARIDIALADEPARLGLHSNVGILEDIGRRIRPSALAWSTGLHPVERARDVAPPERALGFDVMGAEPHRQILLALHGRQ